MATHPVADDQPSFGDVLITTEAGLHFLSVVPHPHRLSFSTLPHAISIARKWAVTKGGQVWHTKDGTTVRLSNDDEAIV